MVDPARFLPADHELYPGHWDVFPARWPTAQEGLLAGEVREVIAAAIAALPVAQRTVIGLRDIEGWNADEVVVALDLSPGNQRVLLHRARSRVRNAIEAYSTPMRCNARRSHRHREFINSERSGGTRWHTASE